VREGEGVGEGEGGDVRMAFGAPEDRARESRCDRSICAGCYTFDMIEDVNCKVLHFCAEQLRRAHALCNALLHERVLHDARVL